MSLALVKAINGNMNVRDDFFRFIGDDFFPISIMLGWKIHERSRIPWFFVLFYSQYHHWLCVFECSRLGGRTLRTHSLHSLCMEHLLLFRESIGVTHFENFLFIYIFFQKPVMKRPTLELWRNFNKVALKTDSHRGSNVLEALLSTPPPPTAFSQNIMIGSDDSRIFFYRNLARKYWASNVRFA